MKNTKNSRGLVATLVLSLVANVVLLVGISQMNSKTHYFQIMGNSLGLCELNPRNRGDYWCIQGWTNTLRKMDYDADVVFIGSSQTCGGNFQDYFPNVKTCNLGYPGDNMNGVMLRVKQVKVVHPEKVFVLTGINGLRRKSEKTFETQYQGMVDSIKSAVPQAEIYLQSILPVNHSMCKGRASSEKIIKSNETIAKIAARSNCVYVDLWSLYENDGEMPKELTRDGVHLIPEAYNRWAEEIKKYIE
ncbi:MAG: hypothetical protein IKT08_07860 [Bacteroidales bacterium]|nr:hypothetical protein [Bacteroidales bacterium]